VYVLILSALLTLLSGVAAPPAALTSAQTPSAAADVAPTPTPNDQPPAHP
jgi:hypothetical protein